MAVPDALLVLAVVIATLGVLAGVAYWIFGTGTKRKCERCGSAIVKDAHACQVCGAPVAPVEAHPGADPYGYGPPDARDHSVKGHYDPKAGYLNGRMTARIVKTATIALGLGLLVRVLGMLEGLGVDVAVSNAVLGGLTILGGLVAFISFVVLDAA